NVYTFCLAEPPTGPCRHFPCNWLVGMSSRGSGQIRIGCGRYDWYFGGDGLVGRVVIAIDVMKMLASEELPASMTWLSTLPYPWCSASEAAQRMPALQQLTEIRAYLNEVRPLAPAA